MRKITSLFMIGLLILVSISCKKDKSESKTDQLTGKYWITTAMTIDPAINLGGTLISDVWSQIPACGKDDMQKFETNGVFTMDEGATKCDPNDPQTTTGTWAFNADETIVSVTTTGANGTETISYNIKEMSSSKMVITHSEIADWGSGAMNYTYTITAVVK